MCPSKARSSRGHTLLELMVSSLIVGLLLAITFFAYTLGARTFAKADTQVDMLQKIQVVLGMFVRDGQGANMVTVCVDPAAQLVAFPCARDDSGKLVYDSGQFLLKWQRYCIYFYNAAQKTVYYRELKLVTPTVTPVALTSYDDGSGPHPANFYSTVKPGDRKLAENVTTFQPQLSGGAVTLSLQGSQLRMGSELPEVVVQQASVRPRN